MATAKTKIVNSASEQEWELHRETICSFYLHDNLRLEGDGGVMERMAEIHHFHATKSQYEAYFRKWNFRKNRPKQEWIAIALHLKNMKRNGLESEVYIGERIIPKGKIKKETSRFRAEIEKRNSLGDIPSLPDSIRIITSTRNGMTVFPYSTPPQNEQKRYSIMESSTVTLHNLPFFEFTRAILGEGVPSQPGVGGTCNVDTLSFLQPLQNISALLEPPVCEASFINIPAGYRFNQASVSAGFSQPQSDMQINVGKNRLKEALESLKQDVFLVTNNHFNKDFMPGFLRNVTILAESGALRRFLQWPGITASAFAEKLFPYALEAESIILVQHLLQRLGNSDDYKVGIYSEAVTPLAFACLRQNLKLVRSLLEGGADVNKQVILNRTKSFVNSISSQIMFGEVRVTSLSLAINPSFFGWPRHLSSRRSTYERPVDLEIVRILLNAGANVNPILGVREERKWILPLSEAAAVANLTVLKLLLECSAEVNEKDYTGETPLQKVFRNSGIQRTETVLDVAAALINAGADINSVIRPQTHPSFKLLVATIDYVAQGGDVEIFKFIWAIGARAGNCTLQHAVESENLELVRHILHIRTDAHTQGETYTGKELSVALKNGSQAIVELLLRYKIIPWTQDGVQDALREAAGLGHRGIVQHLLGIALKNQDEPGWDLSDIADPKSAISTGQYDIAEYLIDSGGRVGTGTVVAAIEKGNEPLVRTLLELSSDMTTLSNEPIGAAIRCGNYTILAMLIDFGFSVDDPRGNMGLGVNTRIQQHPRTFIGTEDLQEFAAPSPLALAASYCHLDMIRLLLESGAHTEDSGALLTAVAKRNAQVVRVLLEAHSKSHNTYRKGFGCGALLWAIRIGDLETVRMLLSHGIDPNSFINSQYESTSTFDIHDIDMATSDTNSLCEAIRWDRSRDLSILREILSKGGDPNSIVSQGHSDPRTALMEAINSENLPALKLLIDLGANFNPRATRKVRKTPLQAACEVGNLEAVKLLLSLGADINALPGDIYGATALQFAAIGGHVGIASMLISNGAEVNAPAAKVKGRTALEGAAEHGRIDMIQLLLNAGAGITGAGEKQYVRALKFASRQNHKAAKELLESALSGRNTASLGFFDVEFA